MSAARTAGLDLDVSIARAPGVLAQRLDDEIVLLDPNLGHYFALNSTGASLWDWLGENHARIGDLVDLLLSGYDVPRSQGEEDVLALVRELLEHGLVVRADEDPE